ncbi:MAG: ATP-binding protein, partial [Bdellovibrionota bacterium]
FLSIDLAERSLPPDHPARERVLMAKRFTKRGQALMKQILAFSRKARLELRTIPLLPAIEDAIQLMRATFPKSIAIAIDAEDFDQTTAVLSDATQLQQVLINLGSNAAYAMRKNGGTLSISLRKRPEENEVTLRISDTGEGMDENVRTRIFEPFFTTKPQGDGTGVGLSVVHGIVTGHGGRITVESTKMRGTEFTIVLPTVPLDLPEEQLADLQSLGGSEKILIVDDEAELLDLLADTLGTFGYEISKASTANEALESLKQRPVDLLLTDFSMPGKNGIELARVVRRDHPTTKIILCTGYRDLFGSETATSDLIDAKVSKPLDALALNREIRACLSRTP